MLALGVVVLGVVIVLLWRRVSRAPAPTPQPTQTTAEVQAAPPPAPKPEPKPAIEKPEVPPQARLEDLTALYTKLPGVLGAVLADRFGQIMAADTDLFLDDVAVPAYFLEILKLAAHERLTIGKPKRVLLCGEGSYWVIGDVAGMPWGVWFERDIEVEDGIAIAEDFRNNIVRLLKKYYTRIW